MPVGQDSEMGANMPMDLADRELLNEILEAMQGYNTAFLNVLETLKDLQKGQMMLLAMAQEHRPADIKPLSRQA